MIYHCPDIPFEDIRTKQRQKVLCEAMDPSPAGLKRVQVTITHVPVLTLQRYSSIKTVINTIVIFWFYNIFLSLLYHGLGERIVKCG